MGRIAAMGGTGVVVAVLGLGGLAVGGSAAAATCTCPTTAASQQLAFTGFDAPEVAALGAGLVAAGGGLLAMSRRRSLRPAMVTLGGAAVAATVVLLPFSGVADAATTGSCACPATSTAVTTTSPSTGTPGVSTSPAGGGATTPGSGGSTSPGSGDGGTPPASVPESPFALALPLVAATMAGAVLVRRERRQA